MRKLILFMLMCLLFAVALVVGVIMLRRASVIPPVSGDIVAQTSQNWGAIPFGTGKCAVVNNTWNRAAAGKGFEQSVFLADVSGSQAIGWRWRAPWHLLPRVVSLPEIICGNKPWDAKTRPNDGFPFPAGTKRLTAEFEVNLRAQGVYNMAFSLWAVSAIPASRKDITHEITIWTEHVAQPPAGQRVDSMSVNGVTYDVYIEEQQRDASGQNANTWTYVAFVAQKPVLRGPLEISAFVDYLLRRGTLSPTHFLTSLEFGNEICQGAGVTEIQGFAIKFH
jgi:Glycosyl hydrolase family 12